MSFPSAIAWLWAASIVEAILRAAERRRYLGESPSTFGRAKKRSSAAIASTAVSSMSVNPEDWFRPGTALSSRGGTGLLSGVLVDLGDVLGRQVLSLADSAGRSVAAVGREHVGRAAHGRGIDVVVAPGVLGARRCVADVRARPVLDATGLLPEVVEALGVAPRVELEEVDRVAHGLEVRLDL